MVGADTNILVRLLTADDPEQFARAQALFEAETIFLAKTVLLETEWVLRRAFRLQPSAVIDALDKLVSLSNVRCEDEPAVRHALGLARAGMEFADALHLASCRAAGRFVTFDAALVKAATAQGVSAALP